MDASQYLLDVAATPPGQEGRWVFCFFYLFCFSISSSRVLHALWPRERLASDCINRSKSTGFEKYCVNPAASAFFRSSSRANADTATENVGKCPSCDSSSR